MINSNLSNNVLCGDFNVGVSLSYLFKDFSVAVALSIFCLISRRKSESTNKDCFCLLLLLLRV